jgi:hypothetical protein
VVCYVKPIVVDKEWLKEGKFADRKAAAKALTDLINEKLHGVTTNAPDWEYSMAAMTAMRLHQPHGSYMHMSRLHTYVRLSSSEGCFTHNLDTFDSIMYIGG